MPRIDPIQLLNCLSVLMSPDGGIKSRDEVHRLAGLMTKYSKKLVSKCIYIQILKCTETDLLELFMGSGGWKLVHTWLTESVIAENWPLVRELLELLLLCPVDIERLKTNNCPKLVKELSKDENIAITALASKLVEQWLKTVKGEKAVTIRISDIPQIIYNAQEALKPDVKHIEVLKDDIETKPIELPEPIESVYIKEEPIIKEETIETDSNSSGDVQPAIKDDVNSETDTLPVLKITLKNGKQVVSQIKEENKSHEDTPDKDKSKEKHRSKSKDKSHDKTRSSSSSSRSSSSSKHSSKSSSDKHRSSHKDSPSSKHSSSKEKSRDKDRQSSHSSKSKSSSSSSKSSSKSKDDKSDKTVSDKDKSKEKDTERNRKSSTEKMEETPPVPSIQKLGKIPKLSDVKKEKPSISIEVRKPDEPKPKTVKTFHSKFRKHGLEEEIKPPPSRATILNKKPPPVLPPTVSIPKRPSPVHNEPPPEKKPKTLEINEKPGSIKLIPPKPKPMVLQESDMFMDALNASATNKKEPKKRKRRTSGSKDAPNEGSPPHTPTGVSSPNSENKSVPPRFYQDTLDEEDNKDKSPDTKDKKSTDIKEVSEKDISEEKKPEIDMDTSEPHTLTVNGLKGVLCYHKRKGPKKSIKWKPDSELEDIQYFELDETERVNVTKTFTDMKYLERIHERDAFQKARNLINDDVMEERTSWRPLIPLDVEGQVHIEYGKNSKEKDIQAIRQKGTLQPLYFHKAMIPDSPHEPEPETHTYSEPVVIPLEDATGNQDNVSDFRNMPWPEPKGNAPPANSNNMNVPTMFPTGMSQFPNNFPPAQFPGVPPGFPSGQPMMPGEWPNGVPLIPNGMPVPMPAPGTMGPGPMVPGPMPPGPMPPGNMPPGMMVPPESMMMGPEMFGGPNPMFPVPVPEGFNMQPNMFPPVDFNMAVPPGPDSFNGPGNFRGAMRGRGSGGHWRGKQSNNWEGPQRGRGGRGGGGRKTVCIYFQRKGSCRQGDNCSFLHPGVNGPY